MALRTLAMLLDLAALLVLLFPLSFLLAAPAGHVISLGVALAPYMLSAVVSRLGARWVRRTHPTDTTIRRR